MLCAEYHLANWSPRLSAVAVRLLRGVCVLANWFDSVPANHRSLRNELSPVILGRHQYLAP
jgi:hypothetical protein